MSFRKRLCALTLCIFSSALCGCSMSSGPSAEAVNRYIASQLPSDVKLKEMKVENYADKSAEGVGRSSIIGTLELAVDRYSPSSTVLLQDLKAAGVPESDVAYFASGFRPVYVLTEKAGKAIPFTTEIRYTAVVDGFRFQGGPRVSLSGVRADQAPVVKDSPNYKEMIGSILAVRDSSLKAEELFKSTITSFFSTKDGYTYYADVSGRGLVERFKMSLTGPLVYQRQSPKQFQYKFNAEAIWSSNAGMYNSKFKSGDRTPLLIEILIDTRSDSRIQSRGHASLVINLPDPDNRGSFYHTFNEEMLFRNDAFVNESRLWIRGSRLTRSGR